VRRGGRLEVAYYDQQRAQLDLDAPVAHNINARSDFVLVNGQNRHVSGYLRDFLFRPDQLLTPARALSGGERNRLLLARLFAQPANMLVLDEPTNDLDIDTLELLQELVADFAGTLLLVSHDRAFLDNVVTSLLVLEGDGRVRDFVGGYSDWARWRDERDLVGAAARVTAAAPVRDSPVAAPVRRKLSYKDRRELAELPGKLETLENDRAELAARVADPSFYAQPHTEVAASLARLAELDTRIEAAFARWVELEGN
jgi:ATP-binding cassette subfamily F protein uup